MKKTFIRSFSFLYDSLFILNFVLFFIFTSGVSGLYAQSTEIRPGIILPQMTTSQRTALSATNGMLIFDTNTQSYWLRSSGSWTELPKTAANINFWEQTGLAGNEIKNTNSGGFWSANPTGLTYDADNTTNPPTAPVSGAGTRLMWIPSRSAFRVGTISDNSWDAANIGLFSFASGKDTKANGNYSTSMGSSTTASGKYSIAMGKYSRAKGWVSTAMGDSTEASGYAATSMGRFTIASSNYSTAMGKQTIANGLVSTAMGEFTTASGYASTAMGEFTVASGINSTAMGFGTTASGDYSTAMGNNTTASGSASTSMGYNTIASGDYSTAMGRYNALNPNAIFMVGNGADNNNRVNLLTIRGDNNFVGIGEDNPIAHLHVGSQGLIEMETLRYFETTAAGFIDQSETAAYTSIYANHAIISGTLVGAAQNVISSDIRIKNIINRSDNVADLDLLKKLQITNYRMKDEGTWGKQIFKKVIAQEVEKIYPEAVRQQTSVIPDIYALAEKVNYDANKKELTISMCGSPPVNNYDLKIGDKIELVHREKGKVRTTISAVSGNSFTVKDWLYATDKIFVFGREVDDFRVVDYEALSMLGISAIQALAKENEALRMKNEKMEARLDRIETALKSTIQSGK
jgi:Head domain of trimeric autotransporter adhesin/Chaperone of endosialidase